MKEAEIMKRKMWIGLALAARIVQKFGADTLRILEEESRRKNREVGSEAVI